MPELSIREMHIEDEVFVSTCSHIGESTETDACAAQRRRQFAALRATGAVFKVARLDECCIGFAYGIPIEHASWGPHGEHLMVIPCLYVLKNGASLGAGKRMIAAIEDQAREAGFQGIAVTAYRDIPGAEWFMPSSYFEHLGFTPVASRGQTVLLWKSFSADASPPHFLVPHYVFEPEQGKVVVDLFWNSFCLTSAIEAKRVREVCHEFGETVKLREYQAEDRTVFLQYQIARAVYVNGKEIGWGFEAPKEGIRKAIQAALLESESV